MGIVLEDYPIADRCLNVTHVEGYTPRQVQKAKLTRKLYNDLSAPEYQDLKFFLRHNIAKNIPIILKDVNLVEGIFSKGVENFKGKSTCPHPHPQVISEEDFIELPPELLTNNDRNDLALDIISIYINEQIRMATIDRTIKFCACVPLDN